MFFQVAYPFSQCIWIWCFQFLQALTSVILQSTNGCNEYNYFWTQARISAFDVKKFFCPKIRTKARFGYYIIRKT